MAKIPFLCPLITIFKLQYPEEEEEEEEEEQGLAYLEEISSPDNLNIISVKLVLIL